MKKYQQACETLLYTCANCQKEEKVLIVTDPSSYEIAKALWDTAVDFPNKALIMMEDRVMHGDEPPALVAEAMMACDVMFRATKFSLSHAQARRRALKSGKRDINMADYRLSMLESGGLFVDFIAQSKVVDKVADVLPGKVLHVTTPTGTDITFDITGSNSHRVPGMSLVGGQAASPPDIEANIGAVEGTANGIVRVDGSIPHPRLGLIKDEVWLTAKNGVVTDIKGGSQAKILAEILAEYNDPYVYYFGEIGIGLNPMCQLSGSMLEDEGCYGTVHFGIGNNTGWGGTASCTLHLDAVIQKPTLTVDGRYILRDGELVI